MAMTRLYPLLSAALVGVVALACQDSGSDESDASAKRTEPWRATPEGEPKDTEATTFRLLPSSRAGFVLRRNDPAIGGSLSGHSGQLDLHLTRLADTRGTFSMDLSTTRIERGGVHNEELTRKARVWLQATDNPKKPAKNRGLAQFQLDRLDDLSSEAAHRGHRLKDKSSPETAEVRRVRATAVGQLTLRGFRVERAIRVNIEFYYSQPAEPGVAPHRVVIKTARSFPVSLLAHDIVPRTEEGHAIAKERDKLKKQVGNEARLTAELVFAPGR